MKLLNYWVLLSHVSKIQILAMDRIWMQGDTISKVESLLLSIKTKHAILTDYYYFLLESM
jgi:methylthioribose-1-phosphate isomerase